ncbi:MAG: hypothetical protein ACP5O7_11885 [Phycisphaerae bacterium]
MMIGLVDGDIGATWRASAERCGFKVRAWADEGDPNRAFGWSGYFTPWGLAYWGGELEFPPTGARVAVAIDPALEHVVGVVPIPPGLDGAPLVLSGIKLQLAPWQSCPTRRGMKKYQQGQVSRGCEGWDAGIAAAKYLLSAMAAAEPTFLYPSGIAVYLADGQPPADWVKAFQGRGLQARPVWRQQTDAAGGFGHLVAASRRPPRVDIILGPAPPAQGAGPRFFCAVSEGSYRVGRRGPSRRFSKAVQAAEESVLGHGGELRVHDLGWLEKRAPIFAQLSNNTGLLRYFLRSMEKIEQFKAAGLGCAYRELHPRSTAFARYTVEEYRKRYGQDFFDRPAAGGRHGAGDGRNGGAAG